MKKHPKKKKSYSIIRKLRKEGKLPEEVIVKMVEEETTKQQNYLPPEEAVSKSINFAQAIEEGRLNKFAREAKKMLDGVGLKETSVVVSDDILSSSALVTRDGNVVYDEENNPVTMPRVVVNEDETTSEE